MEERYVNIKEASFLKKCKNCGSFLRVIHGNDHVGGYLIKVGDKWEPAGCKCQAAQPTKENPYKCKECGHTVIYLHQTAGELDVDFVPECSKPEPKFD